MCLTLMIVVNQRFIRDYVHRRRHSQAPNPCLDSSGDRAPLS
nr:MAG TPA: hypothetical protein [Caudoviricetes sp.]